MSKYLSATDILSVNDTKTAEVECPEWATPKNPKGLVLVRSASALERDAYEESLSVITNDGENVKAQTDMSNAKAKLVVKCVINEDRSRVFSDEQAVQLGQKNAGAVDRLYKKIQELSGMGRKRERDLEKNSPSGQTSGSNSGSPRI